MSVDSGGGDTRFIIVRDNLEDRSWARRMTREETWTLTTTGIGSRESVKQPTATRSVRLCPWRNIYISCNFLANSVGLCKRRCAGVFFRGTLSSSIMQKERTLQIFARVKMLNYAWKYTCWIMKLENCRHVGTEFREVDCHFRTQLTICECEGTWDEWLPQLASFRSKVSK